MTDNQPPLELVYTKTLAEMSLFERETGNGQTWSFRWYVEPFSYGLSRYYDFCFYIGGYFSEEPHLIRTQVALDEKERQAEKQALDFVKERCKRIGLDEDREND